jgi:hypothetical protein
MTEGRTVHRTAMVNWPDNFQEFLDICWKDGFANHNSSSIDTRDWRFGYFQNMNTLPFIKNILNQYKNIRRKYANTKYAPQLIYKKRKSTFNNISFNQAVRVSSSICWHATTILIFWYLNHWRTLLFNNFLDVQIIHTSCLPDKLHRFINILDQA